MSTLRETKSTEPLSRSWYNRTIPIITFMIAYRNDGAVDIYYQKGLNPKEQNYDALLNKANLIETDFRKMDFTVTENGLDLAVSILDKQNRRISFSVKENRSSAGNYRIIAPIGDTSKNPVSFPVVFLNGFELVQKEGTAISVSIDGAGNETSNPGSFR